MKMSVGGSSGGGTEDRVVRYEPLVEHVVIETMQRLPASVTRDELRSAGLAALAEASRDHDPDRDGDFQRYAGSRIRAALVETLRSIDWRARDRRPRAPADPTRLDRLRDALPALPEDRRAVVKGYFLRQRGVCELAVDLELDEHEVVRLRAEAIRVLSRTLAPALAAEPVPQSRSSAWSGSSGGGSPRILNLR